MDNYHDQASPARSKAGRQSSVAPVHPPSSRTANAAGRCHSFLNLHLSLYHRLEEVPFGANFVHGCLLPIYRCQLSSEARFSVDFPRRCPFSVFFSGPFREEEFAVISRCFNSRCRDCAPSPPFRAGVKVPNRGVDWSSRPRRACYPWGNFSVTSSPQQ